MKTKAKASAKKKQATPIETSLSIEEQTKAFLAGGGVIDQVKQGVSGQEFVTGRKRHIVISSQNPK